MYAVVGCGECQSLWVVEGRPETSQCPTCGTRKPFDARRQFATTDDADRAREVRSRLLADRSETESGSAPSFLELEEYVSDTLDAPDGGTSERQAGTDVRSVVLRLLDELEQPSAGAIREAAAETGHPESRVQSVIDGLRQDGEIVESGGRLRRV